MKFNPDKLAQEVPETPPVSKRGRKIPCPTETDKLVLWLLEVTGGRMEDLARECGYTNRGFRYVRDHRPADYCDLVWRWVRHYTKIPEERTFRKWRTAALAIQEALT